MHNYNVEELQKETREIIENLFNDGSLPDALYIVEHHISHRNFDALEKLVLDLFKLGYEISECEEFEDAQGKTYFSCDAVCEIELKAETIDAQQQEIIPIITKAGASYDGWGTYFEDGSDDEYSDEVEFFD